LGARSVGYVGPRYFVIPILDDPLIEGDELVDLLLKSPGGSITLGGEIIPLGGARGRSAAPLTIVDNDVQHGVLAFSSPTFSVSEASPTATINIIRTNGSSAPFKSLFTRATERPRPASITLDAPIR